MNPTPRVDNPFAASAAVEANGASAVALAQREIAEVQAAMVIAKRFPRDPRECMDRIIMACTRPSLAEQAEYQYARGGQDISGPSIRLAEELARGWGNILTGITELSRANGVSECLAYCCDLEALYRDEKRFHVRHWRDTRQGGYQLKDERDIYELIANQGARRKRSCILAVIPGDVQEAAVKQCHITLTTKIEVTPEKIASMVEKFAAFGVTEEHIEKRIQRRLDAITPALMLQLGRIYNSLKDGMSTAAEWFDVPAKTNGGGNSTSLSEITGKKEQAEKAQAAEPKPEPETKAPEEPDPKDAPITAKEVATAIDHAKSSDQLDEAMDMIRDIPPGEERDDLKRRAIRKYQEIMG